MSQGSLVAGVGADASAGADEDADAGDAIIVPPRLWERQLSEMEVKTQSLLEHSGRQRLGQGR
jgi:hypothetical protein